MAFSATVLRVAIASPSDVPESRDAVERALHSWNEANSATKNVMLLPWRWETSSVPKLGKHPQVFVNEQGVDKADIVIALFGSRLETPTPEAISGTVEEIERSVEHGKHVHLYFSEAPHPNDVDVEQLSALRSFREEISERGLLATFANPSQLEHKVWQAIELDVSELVDGGQVLAPARKRGAQFRVQSKQSQQLKETDSRGRAKYTTKHWLEVTNIGDSAAENVTFRAEATSGPIFLVTPEQPIRLDPNVTWKLNFDLTLGTSGRLQLIISWDENEDHKTERFDFQ